MINSLYDNFKHWSSKGSVWIISDSHFDEAGREFMSENWPDPNQYVKSLNKQIMNTDTLICLGDVGNLDWIKQLRAGYKVLITGNHDKGKSKYKKEGRIIYDNGTFILTDNGLFDEIYDGPLFIADRILLSHEPIFGLEDFCMNIHGHCHNGQHRYDGHINLAADVVNWEPLNLGKEIKNGLLSGVKNYHRNTIDWATEHSIHKKI